MSVERIRIERLHLRVPGLNLAEARRLGEAVGRRLATELPSATRPQALDALDVRVSAGPATGREELIELIAAKVLEGLR